MKNWRVSCMHVLTVVATTARVARNRTKCVLVTCNSQIDIAVMLCRRYRYIIRDDVFVALLSNLFTDSEQWG